MENYLLGTSLISPDDTWTLVAIIAAGVMGAIYLEQNYRWAAKLSGPVLALVAAMALSNLGIMPTKSVVYDLVGDYLVPVAIPLLLLQANVFHIVRTTGTMFLAFHVSAVGTVLGAMAAAFLFRDAIGSLPEVTGIMTGSYTGGSVNFFAIKDSFNVDEALTNPLLVADNFIMAGMFLALLGIAGSKLFLRWYPQSPDAAPDEDGQLEANQTQAAAFWKRKEISLLDVAKAVAVAVGIAALACNLAPWIKGDGSGASAVTFVRSVVGNQYVLITFLSVLVATLFHRPLERIHGADELGAYLLYVFFFVIGLPADLVEAVGNMPEMFAFCLVIAVVNLAVTLSLGRLLGLNLQELLICVNATLGGAPSAAAMAIAKGWPKLVLPALLVGIWGYVIGTFLGVAVAEVLQRVL